MLNYALFLYYNNVKISNDFKENVSVVIILIKNQQEFSKRNRINQSK